MSVKVLLEFTRVALVALRLNKLRSALTALGIIIGVASVIVMQAIGNGATQALQRQISALGTSVLNAMPTSMMVGGRRMGAPPFSEKDMRQLREQLPGIAAMSGLLNGQVTAVNGAVNWNTTASGIHAEYFDVRPWALESGRYFTEDENIEGAKVAILGRTVVSEMFEPGTDPLGAVIRINNIPFEVIGTLTLRGQSGNNDPDDVIFVPLSTARSRLVGRNFATVPDAAGQLAIRVDEAYSLPEVQAQLTTILRKLRRIKPGQDDTFSIRNFAELLQTRNEQQRTLRWLLAVTAAMSLVVGGIGIMNIMLVSVTERTREIGLRMAVGARGRDVLAQFLIEAVLLCLAGGVVGLALGLGVAAVVSHLAGWKVSIGAGTVTLAILASASVGILFGFVPARRAARLNPIEALRHE
jgi:putative ABC transport system permease protein